MHTGLRAKSVGAVITFVCLPAVSNTLVANASAIIHNF